MIEVINQNGLNGNDIEHHQHHTSVCLFPDKRSWVRELDDWPPIWHDMRSQIYIVLWRPTEWSIKPFRTQVFCVRIICGDDRDFGASVSFWKQSSLRNSISWLSLLLLLSALTVVKGPLQDLISEYRIRDQWVNHKVLRSNIISFARTEVIRWSHSKLPDSNVRRSAGKYQKSYKIYLYIDVRINYISCADDRQFAATTRLPTYQCIHIPHATAHFNQMKGFMTVSLPALFHCAKWLSFKRLRFRINCKSF